MAETIHPLPDALEKCRLDIARDIQAEIERRLIEAYGVATGTLSGTVPDPNAEPMTLAKLEKVIADLGPPPLRNNWFQSFMTPPTFEYEPQLSVLRVPYGMQIMKPRYVINLDIDTPRWVRVACLARGGRKQRRKVMRRVWR